MTTRRTLLSLVLTGGATLPTFACELQLLPSKLTTESHRHISSTIYQVFRGSGTTVIDGERLEWSQGEPGLRVKLPEKLPSSEAAGLRISGVL